MAAPDDGEHRTIVDDLLAERAPRLLGHPLGRPLLRRTLYPLLHYRAAIEMAARIGPLGGREALDFLSDRLDLNVQVSGLRRVPPEGRCLIVANHPTGIADGIALYDAFKRVRRDMTFFCNADAVRVIPRLTETVIPVVWSKDQRTPARSRETLLGAATAFTQKRAVVMFPSGRMAYLQRGRLRERPWLPSVINIARRFKAPIVPVRITARNSALFYALSAISDELRDVTLFHELLNKRGRRVMLSVAPPIQPDDLPEDAEAAAAALQRFVEFDLRADPGGDYRARARRPATV